MIEVPEDPYEAWFNTPVDACSPDPRFNVRRATPEDFNRIYDCVDAAFGRKRPRELYDWWYLRNPYGKARMWILEEIATKLILKNGGSFPWPIWKGDEALMGAMSGDAATMPEWQRKGLSHVRRVVNRAHPWRGKICTISGPNEGSRIVTTKKGEASDLLGPLQAGLLILRGSPLLEKFNLPSIFAKSIGGLATLASAAWRKMLLSAEVEGYRLVPITRFSADFDQITIRTMRSEGFWCPHGHEFLNWRYIDYPTESYLAFGLERHNQIVGYTVIRMDGDQVGLSEFAADEQDAPALMGLLLGQVSFLGGAFISFFSTRAWKHWALFHRAGMLPYKSPNHFEVTHKQDEEDAHNIEMWQVTPGDRDYH